MVGQNLAHYFIKSKIGSGGMGVVYLAEDTRLKREVAIKFLPKQIANEEHTRERFKIEAQAAAALNHPNIATIYAIEEQQGQLYIVMEYIDGQSLEALVAAAGTASPLPLEEALHYALQAARGLQAAHDKGIVHRDIKPANLMVTSGGQLKILDFGLAKTGQPDRLTQVGMTVGTIAFMSPEQTRGEEVDHRTDIWSLGVAIYEMLCGELPFKGHYEQAIIYSILNEDPPSLDTLNEKVSPELAAVVARTLQKEAGKRYQNLRDFVEDIEKARSGKKVETTAQAPAQESAPPSIVVLPFADMSAEKDQEYFCDGMTDELIDALAKVEGWRVVSRTSAFAFKGKVVDIRAIGEQLRVSHALEGSLRKAGNRVRISSQLTNIADGFQMWSERYDREIDDVFAIQEDIATSIVSKLKSKLVQGESEASLFKRYTENIDAYHLYLQARFELNKRTESGLKRGIELCEQAIAMEPDYALAYAGLADGYILLSFQGHAAPQQLLPRAKQAAQRALEIDEKLAEAHTSIGCIAATYDHDWSTAKAEFERAAALKPNYATAHHWYAVWYLMPRGHFSRALIAFMKAQEHDPLSLILKSGIGWQFLLARNYSMAATQLRKALDLEPNFVVAYDLLGQVYIQTKQYTLAEEALKKAVELSGRRALSYSSLAYLYAVSGRRDEAEHILRQLKAQAATSYISSYDIALIYAGLGEVDEAFAWLQKAFDEHNGWLNFLNVEPRFDSLRGDHRFDELTQKVGLTR